MGSQRYLLLNDIALKPSNLSLPPLQDTEEALKKELSVLGQGDLSSDNAITGSPLGSRYVSTDIAN